MLVASTYQTASTRWPTAVPSLFRQTVEASGNYPLPAIDSVQVKPRITAASPAHEG